MFWFNLQSSNLSFHRAHVFLSAEQPTDTPLPFKLTIIERRSAGVPGIQMTRYRGDMLTQPEPLSFCLSSGGSAQFLQQI